MPSQSGQTPREIVLGCMAKDSITGFQGRVVVITEYLTGCSNALLAPPCDADGKFVESVWFDVPRLSPLTGSFWQPDILTLPKEQTEATPGPDRPAPKR